MANDSFQMSSCIFFHPPSSSFIILVVYIAVYVPEDTEPGTNIALVTAKDADAGKNGKVLVFIESISTEQKSRDSISRLQLVFNLTEVGFLSINKKLDREATDRYDITLKSCDHGSPVKYEKNLFVIKGGDIGKDFRALDF